MTSDPVDRQHAESEEDPPPQFRDGENILQRRHILEYLGFAASRFDLFSGSFAEFVGLYGQGFTQFTISKDFYAILNVADQASLTQYFQVNYAPAFELFKIAQIHQGVNFLGQRGEATLGQPALQRHLTAFKAGLDAAATAGLLSLVPFASRFAGTGTGAATDTLFILCGTGSRLQIT